MCTFLSESANVKHLTFAGDIGVVTTYNFAFAGETRRPDRGHITNLFIIITQHILSRNELIFVVGKKTGISLTNLRHVDRGGLSREQDGQQQEERVPSRDCETTKNHLAVVMSRMQRTTD